MWSPVDTSMKVRKKRWEKWLRRMAAVPKYKKLFKLFKTDIQPGINADDQVGFEYILNTCIMYPKFVVLLELELLT